MGMDGTEPRSNELRDAAVAVSAAELDAASLGFHRAFPRRSAKRVIYVTQILFLAALAAAFVWAMREAPALTFGALHFTALALFALAIGFRLIAASSLKPLLSRLAEPKVWPIYRILCPLYREANVAPDLVSALDALDYPGT